MQNNVLQPPPIIPLAVQQAWVGLGYAVWQLQVLEEALVTHHVLLYELERGRATRNDLRAAVEKRRGQTLGTLLKLPGFAQSLTQATRDRLAALLAERNWLMHRSRREVHVDMYTPAGAEAAVIRINAVGEDATTLMKDVQHATEARLVAKGMTKDVIDRNAAAVLSSWEHGRRHPNEVIDT